MQEILAKANELGQLIKESEVAKTMLAAEQAVEADVELQKKIGAFNEKREMMMDMMQQGSEDQEKIASLNDEIRQLYDAIMANKHMTDYNTARQAFDDMSSKVNGIITYYITGQNPAEGGCSGSCSSCAGCH